MAQVKPCPLCGKQHNKAWHLYNDPDWVAPASRTSVLETKVTPKRQAKAAEEAVAYLLAHPEDRSLIEAGLRTFFQTGLAPEEVPF